jgi:hypothetical protein
MGRSGEEGVLVNRIVIASGPDGLVKFADGIFIGFRKLQGGEGSHFEEGVTEPAVKRIQLEERSWRNVQKRPTFYRIKAAE